MTEPSESTLQDRVLAAVRTIRDPEIPVNIYDLGLVYELTVSPEGDVRIRMTLTTPACPVAAAMPGQVQRVIEAVSGVRAVDVQLVWEPPWTPERMSPAARLALNLEAPEPREPFVRGESLRRHQSERRTGR